MPPSCLAGAFIGTFDSEEAALAGWRELPLGSKFEGERVKFDKSAELIGVRPPAGSTDSNELIYIIFSRLPDGRIRAYFTMSTPSWTDEDTAGKMVRRLQEAGSPMSTIFTRK